MPTIITVTTTILIFSLKLFDIVRVIEKFTPGLEIGVADTGTVRAQDAKSVLPGFVFLN